MKVTLEHGQYATNFFGTKHAPCIYLTVEFSNEELEVIRSAGLKDYLFYKPPVHSHFKERMQNTEVLVEAILNGEKNQFIYDNDAIARIEEDRIGEALKTLKAAIVSNSTPLEAKKTFEL